MKVHVHLNESPDHYFGYEPSHVVEPSSCLFAISNELELFEAAHRVYHLCNIDPNFAGPKDRVPAMRYRLAGNRSLSVGDVLLIDETWVAVARVGFDVLESAPQIRKEGS